MGCDLVPKTSQERPAVLKACAFNTVLSTTSRERIGRRVTVRFQGEGHPLNDVRGTKPMARCRCWNPIKNKPKHMRLRSDGWKRCYRCGVEVMGLTLRAKLGRERMQREGWALLPSSSALPADPHHSPKRLPVVWSSSNDNHQDQYGATLDAVRGEMGHV